MGHRPIRISIGVVAHQQRRALADQLAERINADIVSIDDGTLGCGGNHRHVMRELAGYDSDWSLIAEDDCVPVLNFTGQLHKALTVCPTNMASAYLGKSRPPQYQAAISDALAKAHANDACWITSPHCLHAVALAIRTPLLPPLLKHLSTRNYLPVDEAISSFCRATKQLVAYTVPSLVEHPDLLPTLVTHRDRAPRPAGSRTAWQVGTRTTWTPETVTL